jgi:hypothetical protein
MVDTSVPYPRLTHFVCQILLYTVMIVYMVNMVGRSWKNAAVNKRFKNSAKNPGMLNVALQDQLAKLRGLGLTSMGFWVTAIFGAMGSILMAVVVT